MARKYDLVTIDDVVYELHAVKSDGKSLGLVPVRVFDTPLDFRTWVTNEDRDGEMELVHADWKYGHAVRLQRMAREMFDSEKFTEAAMNKAYNTLTPDECKSFHGNHLGLVARCKEIWDLQQADVETDETHVFEELL